MSTTSTTALFPALTPGLASAAFGRLGVRVAPGALTLVRRDAKWLAWLPDGRQARFAATADGLAALRTERRVLRVLAARCPGLAARRAVPRVVAESTDGAVDLRAPVPGAHDTYAVYHQLRDDPAAAARVGAALGGLIAAWHARVEAADVAAWLPRRPGWPEPRAWVAERLPRVVDDPALHAAADAVMARYEAADAATPDADRVFAHGDLGLHNVSVDAATLAVRGVFDWEAACWADRHHDFRYCTFPIAHDALLEAAIAAYEPVVGRRVSRPRVHLYNAACAITYLAFRDGVAPDVVWAGRTLAEDLPWTRHAIARVGL